MALVQLRDSSIAAVGLTRLCHSVSSTPSEEPRDQYHEPEKVVDLALKEPAKSISAISSISQSPFSYTSPPLSLTLRR